MGVKYRYAHGYVIREVTKDIFTVSPWTSGAFEGEPIAMMPTVDEAVEVARVYSESKEMTK